MRVFSVPSLCFTSQNLSLFKYTIWKNEYPLKQSYHLLLRGRFTLHRHTVCRKPRTFGHHDCHMILRYSCQHSHFWYLQENSHGLFVDVQNVLLPFPWIFKENRRFGDCLELRYIFGAWRHRPVSYYAFFKRWLLPSLLSGCFRPQTSFPTQSVLENLSVRSGLFPFRLETLASLVCLFVWFRGIRSFPGISQALGHHHPMSALPPQNITKALPQ